MAFLCTSFALLPSGKRAKEVQSKITDLLSVAKT